MPHESEPETALISPPVYKDLDVGLVTKFHRNVDRVCQHRCYALRWRRLRATWSS